MNGLRAVSSPRFVWRPGVERQWHLGFGHRSSGSLLSTTCVSPKPSRTHIGSGGKATA
jgi:hypothetical protein